MTSRPLRLLAAALLALPLRAAAAPPICDGSTALTLIGMDTSSGRTLFAVAPIAEGQTSWIVELDGDGREARAWPDNPKGRYGGSVGPGPVIAVTPCGPACIQPVRWSSGIWEPLGDSLSAPTASTADPTYDQTGAPWFLLHGVSSTAGQEQTWAFRN